MKISYEASTDSPGPLKNVLNGVFVLHSETVIFQFGQK